MRRARGGRHDQCTRACADGDERIGLHQDHEVATIHGVPHGDAAENDDHPYYDEHGDATTLIGMRVPRTGPRTEHLRLLRELEPP